MHLKYNIHYRQPLAWTGMVLSGSFRNLITAAYSGGGVNFLWGNIPSLHDYALTGSVIYKHRRHGYCSRYKPAGREQ